MRLIVIAGIIAFPISYLVMNYWLQATPTHPNPDLVVGGIFISITSMV